MVGKDSWLQGKETENYSKSLVTHFLEVELTKSSCEKAPEYHCEYARSFFLYCIKLLTVEQF